MALSKNELRKNMLNEEYQKRFGKYKSDTYKAKYNLMSEIKEIFHMGEFTRNGVFTKNELIDIRDYILHTAILVIDSEEVSRKIQEGLDSCKYFNVNKDDKPYCVECNEEVLTDEAILQGDNLCDYCGQKMEG